MDTKEGEQWATIFSPKNRFFKCFSTNANKLMVIRKPPNAHHRPHLMQKEPADLLNLPRHKSRFPVETLMLCCNIDTVKQTNLIGIQMIASPRAIQIIWPYFSRCRRSRDTTVRTSALLCAAIWNIGLLVTLPHCSDKSRRKWTI